MRPTELHPDRRAFLVLGGAGAVLLAGCALNNPFSSERTPAAQAVRSLSPDAAAAVVTVTDLRTVQAELDAIVTGYPALTGRLTGFSTLHRSHLEALEPAVPHGVDTTPTTQHPLPGGPQQSLAFVRAAERDLHDRLISRAQEARSGPFARLLGTMAAGLSQEIVVFTR